MFRAYPFQPIVNAWRKAQRLVSGISRQGGAILGLCGIVFLWGGVLHSLSAEREQALRGAAENAENMSRAFEEHIIRSIKAVDQTLLYVRDSYAKDPAHFDVMAWSKNTQFLTDLTFQVGLIDKSGILLGSSIAPVTTRLDLSDREHFRVHRDNSGDELFISKPILGRASKKWSIQLTRRIAEADGSFNGVVVVSLDPYYLSGFYDSVTLGDRGSVTLVGTDGIVRARAAAGDTTIGQSLLGSPFLSLYANAQNGTFTSASAIDGVMRIYAFRGVRSYPLIVLVGVAEDELLADFRSNAVSYIVVATALTLLLLIVTATIMHREAGLRSTREELRASEARHAQKSRLLEAAVENMSQGIMMIDADQRVQVCNRRAMVQLDLPEELMADSPLFKDVLRRQWADNEFGQDGMDVETWLRGFVLAGGLSSAAQTYERKRPNGRILEIQSTPLQDGGIVRTYTDITERKETETVLRAARDEADHSARVKSEFLAMMSHEIRSPMNGLLGIVELMRDTGLDPEQAHMVELAHQSANSLMRIVNDVLDFSKIDGGAVATVPEPTELREFVRMLVDIVALPAEREGLRVKATWRDDVPNWIQVDPVRLRQIIGNLLNNAVKFTAAGSVELVVSSVISASGEPTLVFAVSDTGIGMSPEVVERLFEPFMQADASTTKNFGGTGLGLSISRRLARILDGDIEVISAEGSGSTFTLTIPLIVATGVVSAGIVDPAISDDEVLKNLRVLLAEDQETNRWLMRRQFARFGSQLEVTEDGHQAFAAYENAQFDLLVTDCHMPGMDGTELTRRIRATEIRNGQARMPILGLTADITSEMREKCLSSGMDEVVSKPINLPTLEEALRRIMARRGNHDLPIQRDTAADQLFDETTFIELFADAPIEGAEWLDGYVEAAIMLNEHLRDCVFRDDRATLKATAHRLTGASLSAGAMRVGMLARTLENTALSAEASSLQDHLEAIEVSFDATREAIRKLIQIKAEPVQ